MCNEQQLLTIYYHWKPPTIKLCGALESQVYKFIGLTPYKDAEAIDRCKFYNGAVYDTGQVKSPKFSAFL